MLGGAVPKRILLVESLLLISPCTGSAVYTQRLKRYRESTYGRVLTSSGLTNAVDECISLDYGTIWDFHNQSNNLNALKCILMSIFLIPSVLQLELAAFKLLTRYSWFVSKRLSNGMAVDFHGEIILY